MRVFGGRQLRFYLGMNPQNCGVHVTGKHQYLWRKSMLITPKLLHNQLNEFSITMNSSWRSRNNRVHTQYKYLDRGSSLRKEKSTVDDILAKSKKQSQAKKQMIKSLLKSEMLVAGMKKLKQVDLLTGKGLRKVKLPGHIKHAYIQ